MKIVLDTNILISAIIFGGKPKIILDSVRNQKHQLIISEEILKELTDVLMRDFHYEPLQISLVITSLIEISQKTDIIQKLDIVTDDPDDNIILETAVDGEAH